MKARLISFLVLSLIFTAIGVVCGWYGAARTGGESAQPHNQNRRNPPAKNRPEQLGRSRIPRVSPDRSSFTVPP